ncbi:MAG TPA: family 20 glycosylhydrolase [Saprospiraceae bacterium]|nr:family 20 glycosylhydrolase [Saprospiraceae bacterium]
MSHTTFISFFIWCLALTVQAQSGYSLIPEPVHLEVNQGSFNLQEAYIKTNEQENKSIAFFRGKIREITGLDLSDHPSENRKLPIEFILSDDISTNPESYHLEITPKKITIESPSVSGQFWAVQTLRQLMLFNSNDKFEIPCVRITDEPKYSWRSNMLDVCRHFFPVDTIKRHLDMLSLYKINTFHWHLTEDQGWRIEIKKYPLLTQIGAWRKKPDGSLHGGFYTQEEIRDIVRYAADRNIEVIPEIELPGHCRAALAAYPHLGCTKEKMEVPDYYGVFQDVYCAGQEETYGFLENVLTEVINLFPGKYIHIGGDEVPKARWSECPACQRRIRTNGLSDEHGLQSYFISRIHRFLKSKGKVMIGWDEILEGGMDQDAIIEVWRGQEKASEALAKGNKIIQTLYFDSKPATLTMEKTWHYDPSEVHDHENILGAECPLWTEWVNSQNLDYMMYPRLQAFAEVLWSRGESYAAFRKRLQAHYEWMEANGILYGAEDKNLLQCGISFDPVRKNWNIQADFGMPDMEMRYFYEGRQEDQAAFKSRISLTKPGKIHLKPFRKGREAGSTLIYHIEEHLAIGIQPEYKNAPHAPYNKPGSYGLTDGIRGSMDFRDGNWLAWQGEDLDVMLDFGKETTFSSISLRCMQQTQSWILLPSEVGYLFSTDGKDWQALAVVGHNKEDRNYDHIFHDFEYTSSGLPVKARYIRVVAKNYGLLPEWHLGNGGKAWIFADEVIIK